MSGYELCADILLDRGDAELLTKFTTVCDSPLSLTPNYILNDDVETFSDL